MRLTYLAGRPHSRVATFGVGLAALALAGCQSFAPMGLGSLAAKHKEQKIVKQAANDPFPSPKDVGLGGNEKAKSL